MKNIRQDPGDSLRPEYKRSDFGELVQGKYATPTLQFAEIVQLLSVCIGEDEGLIFTKHLPDNRLVGHSSGDWTYEIDNANRITLRFWLNQFASIEEPISNADRVSNSQGRSDLQSLLFTHVRALKSRVDAL